MLDPIACAGMEIGEPRASLDALIDLATLLAAQGARKSSSTSKAVVEEVPDETDNTNCARGAAPDDHGVRFGEDTRVEPAAKGSRDNSAGDTTCGSGRHCREGEAQ